MLKHYYVYVKDPLEQMFWTVHVATTRGIREILAYASNRTLGGDAFGYNELAAKPAEFEVGAVEPGMKGF